MPRQPGLSGRYPRNQPSSGSSEDSLPRLFTDIKAASTVQYCYFPVYVSQSEILMVFPFSPHFARYTDFMP